MGYYCEFCNKLFTTFAKVGLHITENQHIYNKGTQLLKRTPDGIIAFGNTLISDEAWNGFIEQTCCLCNTEFEDKCIHKAEQFHALNLIKIKIDFVDIFCYRKIDDETYHCLTCNTVLAPKTFPSHFESPDHNTKYRECYELGIKLVDKTESVQENVDNTEAPCKAKKVDVSNEGTQADLLKTAEGAVDESESIQKIVDKTKVSAKTKNADVSNEGRQADLLKTAEGVVDETESVQKKVDKTEAPAKAKKVDVSNEGRQADLLKTAEGVVDVTSTGSRAEVSKTDDGAGVSKVKQTKTNQAVKIKFVKNLKELDAIYLHSLGAKDYIKQLREGGMYCLVCGLLMMRSEVSKHLKCRHHSYILQMHKDKLENMTMTQKDNDENLRNETVKTSEDDVNRSKILDSLTEFQENDINIDYVSGTVICKKCLKDLEYNYDIIKGHIDDHKIKPNKKEIMPTPGVFNQNKVQEGRGNTLYTKPVLLKRNESDEPRTSRRSSVSSKDVDEIEAFANKNNMHFSDNKVHCNVCGTHLPPSLKNLKQHIEGANHKYKLINTDNVVVKKRELTKLSISDFVTSVVCIENSYCQDLIINEKICINIQSFLFFKSMTHSTWKCYACDVTIPNEALEIHKKNDRHRTALAEAITVTLASEFIREVRSDIYHCGYCNIVESDWDSMSEHLGSVQHKENKTVAEWRLQQHLPNMRRHEMRQDMHILAFLRLMANDGYLP
ncbi:unnamed protein product [Diatraea saccharalis]|uniref:C2H2-type domain-containing protein n=1 Tax=Diatraea saccharalis TaxID=40085 RepID=A0A9N9RDV3_9NEOP|nr:unnamed protein product [Diatraea saccharalis]